jgi:hypothetical protein
MIKLGVDLSSEADQKFEQGTATVPQSYCRIIPLTELLWHLQVPSM